MNNIKNNILIVIFVLIFILYFYFENKVFYKKKKKIENFQSSNDSVNTIIQNIFSNNISINNNLKKSIDNHIFFFNLLEENNFDLINFSNNIEFKKALDNIVLHININNKLYNDSIINVGSIKNINYLINLKNIFIAIKNCNNLYITYYNSNFNLSKTNFNQNRLILEKKISMEEKILEHHGNIRYLLNNLSNNLPKYELQKTLNDFIKEFINYELNKNKMLAELIEKISIFNILKTLHDIYKNSQSLSTKDSKNLNKGVIQKKKLLGAIIKLIKDENNYTKEMINFKLGKEETKDKEIQYLYSANNNNNVLANFCKKIKKLDKPSEGNLITQRLHKEFKKKKYEQIDKLENEINRLIDSMSEEDINKFNSYMIRTHDQASKQLDAIKIAKDNLENAKKIKINVS